MTLSFDYILQNEEKQQMKRLLNYIRENGYVIQYMAAHKLYTKPNLSEMQKPNRLPDTM